MYAEPSAFEGLPDFVITLVLMFYVLSQDDGATIVKHGAGSSFTM